MPLKTTRGQRNSHYRQLYKAIRHSEVITSAPIVSPSSPADHYPARNWVGEDQRGWSSEPAIPTQHLSIVDNAPFTPHVDYHAGKAVDEGWAQTSSDAPVALTSSRITHPLPPRPSSHHPYSPYPRGPLSRLDDRNSILATPLAPVTADRHLVREVDVQSQTDPLTHQPHHFPQQDTMARNDEIAELRARIDRLLGSQRAPPPIPTRPNEPSYPERNDRLEAPRALETVDRRMMVRHL